MRRFLSLMVFAVLLAIVAISAGGWGSKHWAGTKFYASQLYDQALAFPVTLKETFDPVPWTMPVTVSLWNAQNKRVLPDSSAVGDTVLVVPPGGFPDGPLDVSGRGVVRAYIKSYLTTENDSTALSLAWE